MSTSSVCCRCRFSAQRCAICFQAKDLAAVSERLRTRTTKLVKGSTKCAYSSSNSLTLSPLCRFTSTSTRDLDVRAPHVSVQQIQEHRDCCVPPVSRRPLR